MRQIFIALTAILATTACTGAGTPGSERPSDSPVSASENLSDAPSPAAASPLVVADGDAWIVTQPVDRKHLLLVRPDGTEAVEIVNHLPHEQLRPDWSPDGQHLAFEHTPEGWGADVRDIWISDADGANAEPLVTDYPAGLERMFWKAPAWSPDGSSIVMQGLDANDALMLPARSVLAIIDIATREISVVAEFRSANNGTLLNLPRWSNDGSAFVFTLDHFEGENQVGGAIAVIKQQGAGWSRPDLITKPEEFTDHADWHPTEDLIVFCTYDGAIYDTDEPSNLYTIRPDGSQRTQLTHFGRGDIRATQPTWTSDGRIIFTHMTGEADETLRPAFIRADGSGIEVVDAGENLSYPRLRPTR